MSRTARVLLITVIAVAMLIIIGLGSYVAWSRSHQGFILGSVTVSGMSLEGLGADGSGINSLRDGVTAGGGP